MENLNIKACPRCGSLKSKNWDELDEEQKFLIERMPPSSEFSLSERKKHRFCERCFFESFGSEAKTV